MAFPAKIGSPLHGALLLLLAVVVICNYPGAVQSVDVVEPLQDPAYGCPYVHSWATYKGCKGLYRAVSDSAWFPAPGATQTGKVSYDGTEYTCCYPTAFDKDKGLCTHGYESRYDGTCALAENYCPTLTVLKAANSECVGTYTQLRNYTWMSDNGSNYQLVTNNRDSETQRLKVFCKKGNSEIGDVTEYTCHNPLLPDGRLQYGLNKIKDDWIFVVGRRGPGRMVQGDFFRSFEMTTAGGGSDDKVWVWPLGSNWPNKTVVIAQMFKDEPAAAAVQLSDVRENTFKLHTSHATCSAKHKKERINILQIQAGKHLGANGQMVVVGHRNVMAEHSDVYYGPYISSALKPIVLSQVQEFDIGPPHGFLTSRVFNRDNKKFRVKVQGLDGIDCQTASDCKGLVGWVAIWTNGHEMGVFPPHKAVVLGGRSSMWRYTNYRDMFYTHPHTPEFLRTPAVFYQVQGLAEPKPIVSRLPLSSRHRFDYILDVISSKCPANSTANPGASVEAAILRLGEEMKISKSDDCVLVVESSKYSNLFFVYGRRTYNNSPLFRAVSHSDKAPAWGNYFYAQSSSNSRWLYSSRIAGSGSGLFESVGYVDSYPERRICPDGKFVVQTSSRIFNTKGYVRRALGPTWTICVPGLYKMAGGESKKVTVAHGLPICANVVRALEPNAVGAALEGSSCMAVTGADTYQDTTKVSDSFSCIFQCHLMPGKMKSSFPRQLLGVQDTPWDCFNLIYNTAPDAVGMTYANSGAEKGKCYAEYEGHAPDGDTGFVTCVMGGGYMRGPGGVPPAATTTTTTTTSTTTETTTTTTTETTTTTLTTTTTVTTTTTETTTTTLTTTTTVTTTTTETTTTTLTTTTTVTTTTSETTTTTLTTTTTVTTTTTETTTTTLTTTTTVTTTTTETTTTTLTTTTTETTTTTRLTTKGATTPPAEVTEPAVATLPAEVTEPAVTTPPAKGPKPLATTPPEAEPKTAGPEAKTTEAAAEGSSTGIIVGAAMGGVVLAGATIAGGTAAYKSLSAPKQVDMEFEDDGLDWEDPDLKEQDVEDTMEGAVGAEA